MYIKLMSVFISLQFYSGIYSSFIAPQKAMGFLMFSAHDLKEQNEIFFSYLKIPEVYSLITVVL